MSHVPTSNDRTFSLAAPPQAGFLLRWYQNIAMVIGWPVFGLLCMGGTLMLAAGVPLFRGKRRALYARGIGTKVFYYFLRYLEITKLAKFDLRALESLRSEENIILAPNHPSMLDAALIISRLPNITCIMKSKISGNPLFGIGARLLGYVSNDSPANMVRQSVATLKAGHQLLLFPEGTRTVDGVINPLKGAIALVAKKAQVPVQMLIIESNSPFLGKRWPIFKRPEFPLHYRVRLAQRFEPLDDKQAFLQLLEKHYTRELTRHDQ